jgi:hypothetical protein
VESAKYEDIQLGMKREKSMRKSPMKKDETPRAWRLGERCIAFNSTASKWQDALVGQETGVGSFEVHFPDSGANAVVPAGKMAEASSEVAKKKNFEEEIKKKELDEKRANEAYWKKVEQEKTKEEERKRNNAERERLVKASRPTISDRERDELRARLCPSLGLRQVRPVGKKIVKAMVGGGDRRRRRMEDIKVELAVIKDMEKTLARGGSVDPKSQQQINKKASYEKVGLEVHNWFLILNLQELEDLEAQK